MSDHAQRLAHLSPAKKALLEKMLRQQRATAPASAGIPKREPRPNCCRFRFPSADCGS